MKTKVASFPIGINIDNFHHRISTDTRMKLHGINVNTNILFQKKPAVSNGLLVLSPINLM